MATSVVKKDVPLKHMVLAILSHVAKKGGTRIPIMEVYRVFAELVDEKKEAFPPLVFTKTAYSAYSKRLDDAIQSFIGYGIELPNPSLQYAEIGEEAADRHLSWLSSKYGQDYIESLRSMADRFLSKLSCSPEED
ncbi:MAG: hypothetical protein AABZ64_18360 [Nitrospinota bacterium]